MKSGLAKRILFLVDRRALAAQAVTTMASFEAESGLKFDQIYEVYSQKISREDLNGDMKFDPKVLPTEYLTNPSVRDSFVYGKLKLNSEKSQIFQKKAGQLFQSMIP